MPLSREDIIRAAKGHPIEIPEGAFGPFDDPENFPRDPDLLRAVVWLRDFLTPKDWKLRREAAFIRLMSSAYGATPDGGKGRLFNDADTFGWYLFLAEAALDHPWNYEPMFGSRVVPILTAIGRSLELLRGVDGVDERVRRMIGPDRRQPNGCLFELLVAGAYRRAGAKVSFRPERPGTAKTWDMDVALDGRDFAVECKRLETSAYGEAERMRMRALWQPCSQILQRAARSTLGTVDLLVPVSDVPMDHLAGKVGKWLASGEGFYEWSDQISRGTLSDLDLGPITAVLETDELLISSTRTQELLMGRYVRNANVISALRYKGGMSPRHMGDCDFAIMLRWQTMAPASIDAKARDVLKRLSEANRQLPKDKPGIVHIGFEAVEGDAVEMARFQKILESTERFDAQGKPLAFVYCHYLVPESPPDGMWDFDETVQWRRKGGTGELPLQSPFLVLPEGAGSREGPHWG